MEMHLYRISADRGESWTKQRLTNQEAADESKEYICERLDKNDYSTFEVRDMTGEIMYGVNRLVEAEEYANKNKDASEIFETWWKSLGNGNCEYVGEQHIKYVNQ